MITAQCFVNNYLDGCGYNKRERFSFRDEKGNRFYNVNNCRDCYSVIYNGVPTNNIKQLTNNRNTDITNEYLIDFTSGNGNWNISGLKQERSKVPGWFRVKMKNWRSSTVRW